MILKIPDKLVIVASNPLVCYLIVKVSYAKLLLINKPIIIGIKFEILRELSYIYDSLTTP